MTHHLGIHPSPSVPAVHGPSSSHAAHLREAAHPRRHHLLLAVRVVAIRTRRARVALLARHGLELLTLERVDLSSSLLLQRR